MRAFLLTAAITVVLPFADGSAHAGGIDGARFVRDARTLTAGVRVQMRDADGALLQLALRPVEVFTADARVLLVQADGSERPLPLPAARYFSVDPGDGARGIVVAYDDGHVEGLIEQGGAYRRVHRDGEALQLEPLQDRSATERSFQCGNDGLGAAQYRAEDAVEGIAPAIRAIAPEAALAVRTARLAVDTDEEFLGRFGGNSATATQYVGNLIGFKSLPAVPPQLAVRVPRPGEEEGGRLLEELFGVIRQPGVGKGPQQVGVADHPVCIGRIEPDGKLLLLFGEPCSAPGDGGEDLPERFVLFRPAVAVDVEPDQSDRQLQLHIWRVDLAQ